jgi:hypothetical protein
MKRLRGRAARRRRKKPCNLTKAGFITIEDIIKAKVKTLPGGGIGEVKAEKLIKEAKKLKAKSAR